MTTRDARAHLEIDDARLGPSSPLGSVDKALQTLVVLSGAGAGGLVLGDLASRLDINKGTLHRTLAALKFRGFVAQDASTGCYLLGPAALALGESYAREENLPALLHPLLISISLSLNELCHLGALEGHDVVYLDKVEPERAIRVWSEVGRRRPAARTAMGRAMIAALPVDRAAVASYAVAVPGAGADEVDRLWSRIEDARSHGFAVEREENEAGISCVAVAIRRAGRPVAAISLTAPADRFTASRIRSIGKSLIELTAENLPGALSL